MMSWPEELQFHNGNEEFVELHESAYFYPSDDGDERAQHGASNFLSTSQGGGQVGLTYSASCPSLSGLDGVDDLFDGVVGTNDLISYPFGSQEPLAVGTTDFGGDFSFAGDKNLDMLLQFQQEYQNTSQRQFPHQQVTGQHMNLVQQQIATGRHGLHGSQSFTSLSSMESEYNRLNRASSIY